MKIGVVGKKMGENSFGMQVPYIEYFRCFGDVVCLMPNQFDETIDLLVLPGGADVATTRYDNDVPSMYTGNSDTFFEHFDKFTLPKYIANNTAIFGICRGFQTLMVHFGGKLQQNLWHPYSEKSRAELVHELVLTPVAIGKYGLRNNKGKEHKVNSLHHQGIFTVDVPEEFEVIGTCDSIAEAAIHKELPIALVQFHPKLWGLIM